MDWQEGIRNCAKAIILRDDQILTIKYEHGNGHYFALPGGAQVHGESLEQTLIRECREELGVDIHNLGLRFIREIIFESPVPEISGRILHQVEFIYECSLDTNAFPIGGAQHDYGQVDCTWIPIIELENLTFYPKKLIEYLGRPLPKEIIYWGVVE